VIQELRLALRRVWAAPGLAAAAALCLGVGIGASAILATWARAILLEPLPGVPRSGSLLAVETLDPEGRFVLSSQPEYRDIAERAASVLDVVGFDDQMMALSDDGETERVWGLVVSANYFDALQVRPLLGRGFLFEEAAQESAVAVISHRFWQRRFGGDPAVVGRAVTLNGRDFTIVGVAPPGFWGTRPGLAYDLFAPLSVQRHLVPGGDRQEARDDRWLQRLARLRPGTSREQAQLALDAIALQLAAESPRTNAHHALSLIPMRSAPRGAGRVLGPVVVLLGAVVALLLLVACANVANLLLARAITRRRELAVQLALGATRGRLAAGLLADASVISLFGMSVGVVLAYWGSGSLLWFVPPSDFPIALELGVDARVLGLAAALSALTTLLVGAAPAWSASRAASGEALRTESHGVLGGGQGRLRRVLVSAQMALSVLLLAGAGLFLRSIDNMRAADPGFDARGVLLVSFDLFPGGLDAATGTAFYERLLERAGGLPEVVQVSLGRRVPLGFGGRPRVDGFLVPGFTPTPGATTWAFYNEVGPEYFATLRTPLRSGRDFGGHDRGGAPRVVVINEAMARRYWGASDPLGTSLELFGERWVVVGVARNVADRSLGEAPEPWLYFPALQRYRPDLTLHLRTGGDPAALAATLRELVRDLDARVPIFGMRSFADLTRAAGLELEIAATLLALFGGAALLLAAVGLYGVMAFAVGRRRREIGLRIALGARRAAVAGLVVRDGLRAVAVGAACGGVAFLAAGRLVASQLFGVAPADPWSVGFALTLLCCVALLACIVPAQLALRLDPATALRSE